MGSLNQGGPHLSKTMYVLYVRKYARTLEPAFELPVNYDRNTTAENVVNHKNRNMLFRTR